jgi:ferredoxin
MLSEIIKLLAERGPMSLAALSLQLKTDISVLEPMLALLERKACIRRIETKCAKCKGCAEVKPEDAVFFEAVSSEKPGGRNGNGG